MKEILRTWIKGFGIMLLASSVLIAVVWFIIKYFDFVIRCAEWFSLGLCITLVPYLFGRIVEFISDDNEESQ